MEHERRRSAEEAARRSALEVQLSSRTGGAGAEIAQSPTATMPLSPANAAGQPEKAEFARSPAGDLNPARLVPAASPYLVSAGSVISASLLTGLNSDLPGMVIAQVTENVRDSRTGETVLIPQGARLLGKYDSAVAFGEKRALIVWQRILFPNGSSMALDNMPATDARGFSGLRDRVNSHSWQLLKGVALSTLLGVGSELSINGEGRLLRAVREATQQSSSKAGEQLVAKDLDIQPTLVVRPGWPVRVLVNKDLILGPWKE